MCFGVIFGSPRHGPATGLSCKTLDFKPLQTDASYAGGNTIVCVCVCVCVCVYNILCYLRGCLHEVTNT